MSDRTLCDSTFRSKRLACLSERAFGLFPYIFQQTDDYGTLEADPELIKCQRLPLIHWATLETIEQALQEYEKVGIMFMWEIDGHRYGHFVGFEGRSGRHLSKRRRSDLPSPPPRELAKFLKDKDRSKSLADNNHFQGVPSGETAPKSSYKLSQVKLSQDKKPSAGAGSSCPQSYPQNPPPKTKKQIQNEQIEYTQQKWKEIFGEELQPSQVMLLAFGSKDSRIHGFKSFEALWVWMSDCKNTNRKFESSAFLYAKTLAGDYGGVKAYILRAWGSGKDAQLLADIFERAKFYKMKVGSLFSGSGRNRENDNGDR